MKILALEFSSPQRSVAVVSGSTGGVRPRPRFESVTRPGAAEPVPGNPEAAADLPPLSPAIVVSEVIEAGPARTMKPLGMVEEALKQAGFEREQIEGLAVGLGPGSYTGLRAAIALAQGWELACGMKSLGISSAACVAAQAQADGLRGGVNVVLDAQRGEFHLAGYELETTAWRELSALRLATMAEVRSLEREGAVLIGPEVTRWFAEGRVVFPRAAMLGRLAFGRTDFGSGAILEPIYLREVNFVKAPRSPAPPR
jgi:tRNA threonylcarbamoyladenosine biosynthesis protein TsaB